MTKQSRLGKSNKRDCHADARNDKTETLLAWFDTHGRDLPWRQKGAAHPDPYAVWVSEIMLQQTTVKTVGPYFERWMKRFPSIADLADADIADVLLLWQGLGYYTRAKKLHECARVLMRDYGGALPDNKDSLLKLPGIGPYTAASICCFAYNMPETVVDGNVMRVIARLYGIRDAVTPDKIRPLATALTSPKRGADYASAIMDLGATVCTPTNPQCDACPWEHECVAHTENLTTEIPLIIKPGKKEKHGHVWIITDANGRVYIRKRPGRGLLSGLWEFPWDEGNTPPFDAPWTDTGVDVVHVFTHFKLTLRVMRGTIHHSDTTFIPRADIGNYALSTLMKKVLATVDS